MEYDGVEVSGRMIEASACMYAVVVKHIKRISLNCNYHSSRSIQIIS